jgi:hypothetical protein
MPNRAHGARIALKKLRYLMEVAIATDVGDSAAARKICPPPRRHPKGVRGVPAWRRAEAVVAPRHSRCSGSGRSGARVLVFQQAIRKISLPARVRMHVGQRRDEDLSKDSASAAVPLFSAKVCIARSTRYQSR